MQCQDERTAISWTEKDYKDFKKKWCPAYGTRCKGNGCHAFEPGYYNKVVSEDCNYETVKPFCKSPLVLGAFYSGSEVCANMIIL